MIELLLPFIVSMTTWMTPLPQHAQGLLVTYGSQQLIEANAEWRGYDLSPYPNRCGVSGMSPADLGRIVYLRVGDGQGDWFGPCLILDVAAQHDFYHIVYTTGEVAEVSIWMRDLFKFEHGSSRYGEVYVGMCLPDDINESQPEVYAPSLTYQPYAGYNPRYKSPAQEWPIDCPTKGKI